MHGIRKVGRYELLELLGRGGMADVYLATVSGIADFKRLFAVKMIRTDLPEWERYGQFFIDEAKITVALRHPNVVQVFDLGMSDYGPYLGMEYVDGPDLRQLIGWSVEMRRGVPFNLAVFIARELLAGLASAHDARDDDGRELGIVHRDISPSNVLLSTTGEVKLSDFGVAMATIASQAQGPGAVVGKARYFAPEVARREPATPRSDLFSLGAVLFDLFTGNPLIEGKHYTEIVANLEVFDIDQRLDRIYSIPTPLEDFFRQALATDPAHRFGSARTMLDHLEDFIYEEGVRVSRSNLAEYLQQLEEYIVASDSVSGSRSGISEVSEREMSSVWTQERTDGSTASLVSMAPLMRGSSTLTGESHPDQLRAVSREMDITVGRSVKGAETLPAMDVVEPPEPPKPSPPVAPPTPTPPPSRPASEFDAGDVLALPDADRVRYFHHGLGPRTMVEEDFDDLLEDAPPHPDELVAFDHGELRPFHEWARMGNPRTAVHARSAIATAGPLTVGSLLMRTLGGQRGDGVLQLFDGRQAIGLVHAGDRVHAVWTDKHPVDLLTQLSARGTLSPTQHQVLKQMARSEGLSVVEVAARQGILSTVRMYHEARQAIEEQLERVLVWPNWRVNHIAEVADGWGAERAGVDLKPALERAARRVFSMDWFEGLMPGMLQGSIRPRKRLGPDDLDKLLGKGKLRVKRDLPPGSKIGVALTGPNGEVDPDRACNLYEMVVTGLVELSSPSAGHGQRLGGM